MEFLNRPNIYTYMYSGINGMQSYLTSIIIDMYAFFVVTSLTACMTWTTKSVFHF